MSRVFKETSQDWGPVLEISEYELVLSGGGDFYDCSEVEASEIDQETRDLATELAEKYNMTIDSMQGAWWGYSEYTPDPGDVTIVAWHPND